MEAAPETGRLVTLGSSLTVDQTQFTLTAGTSASVNSLLEFGSELMLVTAKTGDVDPQYTVARGYYKTVKVAHASQEVGSTDPQWPRHRVAEAIRRAFPRMEAMGLPIVKTGIFFPYEAINERGPRLVCELPKETRDVWSVRAGLNEVRRWEFIDNLPSGAYTTGRVVALPRGDVRINDELWVTYRVPYRWSTHPDVPDESSTIIVPEGAEDVPAAYAAAWLVSAREVSRMELDRAQEYNNTEPVRGGVSAGLVRAKWMEFYRILDEARRLDPPMPRRPYLRRAS